MSSHTVYVCDRCGAEWNNKPKMINRTVVSVAYVEANHLPEWDTEGFDLCADCAMDVRNCAMGIAVEGLKTEARS